MASRPPTEHQQRPDVDYARKRMRPMLENAITMGYVTGSIGATQIEEDDYFEYEVSYKITRKRCRK